MEGFIRKNIADADEDRLAWIQYGPEKHEVHVKVVGFVENVEWRKREEEVFGV